MTRGTGHILRVHVRAFFKWGIILSSDSLVIELLKNQAAAQDNGVSRELSVQVPLEVF
jgi:hypothetical protein